MKRPFQIIPWSEDFLAGLIESLAESFPNAFDHSGPPLALIFPHGRPKRYIVELLRDHPALPKPCLVPDMYSVQEVFERVRQRVCGARAYPGMLDRVALMQACVEQVAATCPATDSQWPGPARRLGDVLEEVGVSGFFPWGRRLVNLVEEFWSQGREPEDYQYMEGQVTPFAALLLANLGRIHSVYAEAFERKGWTSAGYDALCAARAFRAPHSQLGAELFEGSRVCMAGFAGLSGSEEALLRGLWEAGGLICLHGDPKLLDEPEQAHWTCRVLGEWLKEWGAAAELRGNSPAHHPERRENSGPELSFYEGHDLHSQLSLLPGFLADAADQGTDGSCAVVLPDSGLLMPVLHHLPDKEVNVSMGYPLERSPLARLVENLLKLRESARPVAQGSDMPGLPGDMPGQMPDVPGMPGPANMALSGASPRMLYYWRPFVECIRHPYLRMLGAPQPGEAAGTQSAVQPGTPSGQSSRRLLHSLERAVLQGGPYIDPRALAAHVAENVPPETDSSLFFQIVESCLAPWENVRTPGDLAAALSALCALLLQHGAPLWDRFPLDAEYLFRLMQHIVPELRNCEAAATELDIPTLFTLLRGLLAEQRVPFEAEPLTAVQVLGMLETRLLRFDRVILLDATDDKLPGSPQQDPLLPEGLRSLAGLPDLAARDRITAYHVFRLLAGARQAHICYQAGENRSGLFDSKKSASRFVEEMVWKEEQATGRLLGADDAPRHTVPMSVAPFKNSPLIVEKSPALHRRLNTLLARPLSPSALDEYLQCPVRFFHSRVANMAEPEQVAEGQDPAAVGDLLHETLRLFYAPRLGRPFSPDAADVEELQALFASRLEQSELAERLPRDALIFLETAGPERLAAFLREQPPGVSPLWLEQELSANLTLEGANYTIRGRIDRLDSRPIAAPADSPENLADGAAIPPAPHAGAVLLDYKSGSLHLPESSLWADESFWDKLAAWQPEATDAANLLPEVAERVQSLQLPVYLYMYGANTVPGGGSGPDGSDLAGSGLPAWDAALIDLRGDGKESFLLGEKMDNAARRAVLQEKIPALLAFTVRHMVQAPAFWPNPGKHCAWCFCAAACTLSSQK